MHELFFAIWFFLPAGFANATPIFVAHMKLFKDWEAPIDCGLTYRGKRILGSHKTWRGLVTGIVAATVLLWLQRLGVEHSTWLRDWTSQVDYRTLPILIMGPLFAIGALGGDAIESFFKRQRGVAPGHGWFPFDQIDYIIGGALATSGFVQLHFWQYVDLLLIWLLVHIVASYIGYMMGLKERPI